MVSRHTWNTKALMIRTGIVDCTYQIQTMMQGHGLARALFVQEQVAETHAHIESDFDSK